MKSSMRQPLVAQNTTRHLDIVNIKDFYGSPPDVMVDTQDGEKMDTHRGLAVSPHYQTFILILQLDVNSRKREKESR